MNKEQFSNEPEVQAPATEIQPVAAVETEAKPDPFATGRERMANIGTFFSKTKESFAAKAKSAGTKLSNFFTRSKTAFKEGTIDTVAAVLSAPALAKNADEKMGKGAENLGSWIGKNTMRAGDFITKGLEAAHDSIDRTVDKAEALIGRGVELSTEVSMKIQLGTREALLDARDSVGRHYDTVVSWGERKGLQAEAKVAKAKKGFWSRVSGIFAGISASTGKVAEFLA